MDKTNNATDKAATRQILGTVLWFVCFVAWVLISTILFLYILSRASSDETIAVEVLQWTVWPYVTFVAAGAITIGVLATGPTVLSRLYEVQRAFEETPNYIKLLRSVHVETQKFSEQLNLILLKVTDATAAANAAAQAAGSAAAKSDEISSQLADQNADPGKKLLAGQLAAHYETAKLIYQESAKSYESQSDQDIERTRGFLNIEEIDNFLDFEAITPEEAKYVRRVLEIEAATRRTSRTNLTSAQLAELGALREQAGYAIIQQT